MTLPASTPHGVYIAFLFALGACIGSFLNVVVWRLPRGESLNSPPSHCPKCEKLLLWRDNVPILGWIKLGGKCRFCREPISIRYPIVEAVTALLFVFYYVMIYMVHVGPATPLQLTLLSNPQPSFATVRALRPLPVEAPIFLLYLFLISAMLAASLIDAELFIIPEKIPWLVALLGLTVHALFDHPSVAGALNLDVKAAQPIGSALAAGGTLGFIISLALRWWNVFPASFPDDEPLLEVDRERQSMEARPFDKLRTVQAKQEGRELPSEEEPEMTPRQIRLEMRKEMLFLLPPMVLAILWAVLVVRAPMFNAFWHRITAHDWVTGLLGSLLGGLIGGFVVWITRIMGTLGFGRLAMGLGDADLMFAVGTVLGAGPATVAFFLAPFFGCIIAVYRIITKTTKEVPYGPYLSLASAFIILFYTPVAAYLAPGVSVLAYYLLSPLSGGG
jgi:leader peptidase (prepilin peptidase)/N-methyltransferase